MRWLLVGLLLWSLAAVAAAGPVPAVVFTHVAVVDVRDGELKPDQAVVVTGNRITAVRSMHGFRVPEGAVVVPAEGKFLMPGLWDMHVHHELGMPEQLDMMLAHGVTGVRDMNSDPYVLTWRDEIRAGKRLGPRTVAAGKYLDAHRNGEPPNRRNADTAEEGRALVRERKGAGAEFIKVYSGLQPEVYRAIIDEAKLQGLPVAGHCPELVSAFEASRLGQRSMEHLTGIALSCAREETALRREMEADFRRESGYDFDRVYGLLEKAIDHPDPEKQAALFRLFRKHRTWQDPTLAVQQPLRPLQSSDPRLKYRPWFYGQLWDRYRMLDPQAETRRKFSAYAMATVRAMHRAGVPLLAGTDGGGANSVDVLPGLSLAEELELLVQCGLKPGEALRTATLNPALYLGEGKSMGTVDAGKRADLVLLDADPLRDIGNVRKIHGVMANGRWLPRAALDGMLARVAEAMQRK